MYNVWRTTVILIVTMYTGFVLYYADCVEYFQFNSIQFNSMFGIIYQRTVYMLVVLICSRIEQTRI